MKNRFVIRLFIYGILFAFISCNTNNTKQKKDLFILSVESAEKSTPALSQITEKIEAIELELTDNSLLQKISRVLFTDEYIIISGRTNVWLFDRTGKFVRQIGAVGQGPGEFISVGSITTDNINKRIYVMSRSNIICYDFEGNLIKESKFFDTSGTRCIYFIEGQIYYLTELTLSDNGKNSNQTVLYTIDGNFQKTDSIEIRKHAYFGTWSYPTNDFINTDGENIYVYYPDIRIGSDIVPDILYQLKNKELIPCLRIHFKNDGFVAGKKNVGILNLYKSTRFVFCVYMLAGSETTIRHFCYDTKTGKGYNFEDGFLDDLHTGEKVRIRPFDFDSNMFYYLHTQLDDVTLEEPNPTLYFGTLKR